jgi:putative ABC transport system permease protein
MRDPLLDDWRRLVRLQAESQGQAIGDDILEELAFHFVDLYAEACERGESREEAYRIAISTLEGGAFSALTAAARARRPRPSRLPEPTSSRIGSFGNDFIFDARYTLRSMRRHPTFTALVVGILAIGIGATTAGFTVLDTVLLRGLPYPQADRLVRLKRVTAQDEGGTLSPADWRDYASRNAASMALAAYASWPLNLTGGGEPVRLRSVIVSGNFFDVMGQRPLGGRVIEEADDGPSAPRVVVLSHGLWAGRFARDAKTVGADIVLNGKPATVVGVMPPEFAVPSADTDLWMPMGLGADVLADRTSEWLSVVGRLRGDARLATAQAGLDVTASSLAAQFPKTNGGEHAVVRPLLDEIVGGVRRALWLGAIAVLIVLFASCANAANLLLARASVRRDEIALRAALGADPGRLARQLLVEGAVLAGAGGLVGIGVAWIFLRALVTLAEDRVPRLAQAHLSGEAVVISVLASAATALLFGGGAAWLLGRARLSGVNRTGAHRSTVSHRLGGVFLTSQVAFALMLVTGALRVAGSYAATNGIDPGFDVSDTLTLQLTLPRTRYPDSEAHVRFAERVREQITLVPGVTSAGVVSDLPFVGNQMHFATRIAAAGQPARDVQLGVRLADPGYFRTLKIPLLAGRYFDAADRGRATPVAVVNGTAQRLWGGTAMGQRVEVSGEASRQIVGVVGDIKHAGLHAEEGPVVYVPYAQKTLDFVNWMGIVVRGPGVTRFVSPIKSAIAEVDRDQPVYDVMAVGDYLARERAPYRFGLLVVGCLAGAAFALAMSGIYGLTAFIVGNRFRELGVRLALGAPRAEVVRLVLSQISAMLIVGSVIGLLGTLAMTGLLRAALSESSAHTFDAPAALGAVVILGVTSIAAALGPALRAGRIDPTVALRAE